jgi:hypothetical protein
MTHNEEDLFNAVATQAAMDSEYAAYRERGLKTYQKMRLSQITDQVFGANGLIPTIGGQFEEMFQRILWKILNIFGISDE